MKTSTSQLKSPVESSQGGEDCEEVKISGLEGVAEKLEHSFKENNNVFKVH